MSVAKVQGHSELLKNTRTGGIVNTDVSAYMLYMKRTQAKQKNNDEIRGALREINSLKTEMHEIKDMLKTFIEKL
jgi:hypothetical protein